MRKSGTLQCRSWKTTCCLVISPFFFCMLVFGLQLALDVFILSRPENECGCVCLECCFWPDGLEVPGEDPPCFKGTPENPPTECTPAGRGNDLTDECKSYDEDVCGIEYSTFNQAVWCAVEHPTAVPTYMQVPEAEYRAELYKNDTAILYTGEDTAAAQALTAKFFGEPDVDFFNAAGLIFGVLDGALNGDNSNGGYVETITNMATFFLGSNMTRAVLEDNLDEQGLQPSEIAVLLDALSIPGMTDATEGLITFWSSTTRNATAGTADSGDAGEALFAMATGDTDNPLVKFLNDVRSVVTRQNTLGTSEDSPQLYYIEEAMGNVQYLLRSDGNSCDNTVPPPFDAPPFAYQCLPVHVVLQESLDEMHKKLFCGWLDGGKWLDCPEDDPLINAYSTAYNFKSLNETKLDVDIYFNVSGFLRSGGQGPGRAHRLMESMNLVTSAFLKQVMGANNISAAIVAVKEMPKLQTSLNLDFASILGPLFFMLVLQLLFPVMLQQLVYEKAMRLRIMMKMHGLSDGVYWLVTFCWYLVLSVVYFVLLLVFGSAIGLKFFTLNSYGVQIIFFLVFSLVQISLAFLLSTVFQSASTATSFGFVYVFALSFMASFLMSNLLDQQSPAAIWLELIPAFALYRGLYEMSGYAFYANYQGSVGLTFGKFSDDANGMPEILAIMIVEFFVFMALAWYLEQVLGQVGTRKHWLFCFGAARRGDKRRVDSTVVSDEATGINVDAADVQEERARVEEMADYSEQSIVLSDLKKVYPPQGGKPAKTACRALTMAVERGECFGLLGPNGAGKTTSINMMVGFLTPSSGTAYIEGNDILRDMDNIYPLMGVCPQHDLLWKTMTAHEHLLFYGRLKGLAGKDLREAAEAGLKSVNLYNNNVGNKQVRTYSGGMKRRLSVAISMIGAPKVVYMDEPSTGLDPASRRNLWDVIKQGKQGRAIILTTHSMEEAEVLCDRLGIFVDGQLQCIGNPKELAARYGGYLVFTITTRPADNDKAKTAVMHMCPEATPTYQVAGTQKFEMPTAAISIADVFLGMQRVKDSVQILDWGVSNASLEDVFVRVATQNDKAGEYL